MGSYRTVYVTFDVSADELHDQFLRHAALYRPRPEGAKEFEVLVLAGRHCSAVWSPGFGCPAAFLYPLGQQLGSHWMQASLIDSDTWTLSCFSGFKTELRHDVNPWAYDDSFVYDAREQLRIDARTRRLCELAPQFAEEIRPYLLLWSYPPDINRPDVLVEREGKARPTDRYEYGDGDQYYDFLSCFGFKDIEWDVAHREKVTL